MNINEIEIPEEIEVTLYTTVCVRNKFSRNIGEVRVTTINLAELYKDGSGETHILLHKQAVKLKIGKVELDIKGEVIKGLEVEKTNELAEHHMKIKDIQDKIDSLLAIEYQGEE